jgi:hypothetical protein
MDNEECFTNVKKVTNAPIQIILFPTNKTLFRSNYLNMEEGYGIQIFGVQLLIDLTFNKCARMLPFCWAANKNKTCFPILLLKGCASLVRI